MFDITKARYNQIQKMHKLQKFIYDRQITYEIDNPISLAEISQQEVIKIVIVQIDGKVSLKVGQIAIIIKNLFDHLLKVYQVADISLLTNEKIQVNFEDGAKKWSISFINLHETNTVSYEENYNTLLKVVQQFFLDHKQSLLNKLNEHNQNELRMKIEWVTIALNDILNILKSRRHHLDMIIFVKTKVKDETFIHNIFIDDEELNSPPQQSIQQNQSVQSLPPPPNQASLAPLTVQQQQESTIFTNSEYSQSKAFRPPPPFQQEYQSTIFTNSEYSQSKAIDPNLLAFFKDSLEYLQIQNQELKEELMNYITKKGKNFNQQQAENALNNINTFLLFSDEYIGFQAENLEFQAELSESVMQLKTHYRGKWEETLKSQMQQKNTDFLQESQQKAKQFAEAQIRVLAQNIMADLTSIKEQYEPFLQQVQNDQEQNIY